jgi:glutamate/tyrosine decarboxylase-like PLP-dependent enzyme
MLEKRVIQVLEAALDEMEFGFEHLPAFEHHYNLEGMEEIMMQVGKLMRDNYPYFHPYYAGQMLKPPHPIAQAAYMLSMWINPNNHALDGGRASSRMEKEAVAEIAAMFKWERFLGHLTSGGTMANLEALWISGQLNLGKKVVASDQAHYTHSRISGVLQLEFESIPCDGRARMDLQALKKVLDRGEVGTVVVTIGTTAMGTIDPLPEILALQPEYGFRLHADAAYGGYFTLVEDLDVDTRQAFDLLPEVDSIVVDPHKHGLQPYGCGCVLYRDPGVGQYYKHDSPYTYFTSPELHLGEISLECSRAGASAVALWATHRLLPLLSGGEFAQGLSSSRHASLMLYEMLASDPRYRVILPPSLDILVWAPDGKSASQISKRSEAIFKSAAKDHLHLATFKCPETLLKDKWTDVDFDQGEVVCLRSCLMKPEHLDWTERIWGILDQLADGISP